MIKLFPEKDEEVKLMSETYYLFIESKLLNHHVNGINHLRLYSSAFYSFY